VAAVADPLGGSFFVEALTDKVEAEAWRYIERIDAMGGIVRAIEEGYPQREIAQSAYDFQRKVDSGERGIVGVNKYVTDEKDNIPTLKIDLAPERGQIERTKAIRARRDAARADAALAAIRAAAAGDENLMPRIIEAVKADVTLGEISQVFREVFGEHRDPAFL